MYLKYLSIFHLRGEIKIDKLEKLEKMIEELREYLNELINEKGNLLDSEVLSASKILDSILNKYNEVIIRNKLDK